MNESQIRHDKIAPKLHEVSWGQVPISDILCE